jgi:putative sterol carrier protein
MNHFNYKKNLDLPPTALSALLATFCISLAACSPMKPADSADSSAEAAPLNGNGQSEAMPEKAGASPLVVVGELGQKVVSTWQTDRALKDEVLLATKFVISGKSAVVIGGGEGAVVKKGMDAVNQVPDMTVTVSLNTAQEIIEGSTTLSAALADGLLETDNEEGFARFLSYTSDASAEAGGEPPTSSSN